LAKQIVRAPEETKPARSRDASPSALARMPSSGSISSGFQSAIVRSVAGAASLSITAAGPPSSDSASCAGFAIVADASTNCGSDPYARASRRRRRSTLATCEPKTPR
jgi:hypothetical protein